MPHRPPVVYSVRDCRSIHLYSVLTPPAVFLGLLVTLWAYKSLMLVVFQNKIIYMPSVPPFSRSEKIEDYAALCRPVVWREERIKAADGTKLALAVGEIPNMGKGPDVGMSKEVGKRRRVVILYFQGNGASIPPRLPGLSTILRSLDAIPSQMTYTIIALSYRGFWTSSGRPSEAGIKLDAAAALSWAAETFPPGIDAEEDVRIVLWGQSLGAGVAVDAAATAASRFHDSKAGEGLRINGLLLETPFVGVKAMLLELYPQRWLPYRYLGPFLRNHWDARKALRRLAASCEAVRGTADSGGKGSPKILILQAGKDELVPSAQGFELEAYAREVGLDVRRLEVKGALHNEIVTTASGKGAITNFLREIGDTSDDGEHI